MDVIKRTIYKLLIVLNSLNMDKAKDITKNENDNVGKTRGLKNWEKLRNLMKNMRKNPSNLQNGTEAADLSRKSKLNIIEWSQKLLTQMEKHDWLKHINLQNDYLKLVEASKIVEAIYQISKDLVLRTYRPVPKFNYLATQSISESAIDTTGVWVWQAQQVLAYFIFSNWSLYKPIKKQTRVLQIGAGCSGLAALTYFQLQNMEESPLNVKVVITDGKKDNIAFLQSNIKSNFPNLKNGKEDSIISLYYLWGNIVNQHEKFDLILAADCIFFQNYHNDLIITLRQLLSQDGVALFVNPSRGKSLQNFLIKIDQENKKDPQAKLLTRLLQFEEPKYKKLMAQRKELKQFNSSSEQFIFMQVIKKLCQE